MYAWRRGIVWTGVLWYGLVWPGLPRSVYVAVYVPYALCVCVHIRV